MKKLIFLLLIANCSLLIVKSQPVNVQSTINYLNKAKYDKAKTAIDQAAIDPKTSTWAKTWYYRGTVYLNICISKDPLIRSLDTNAVQVCYDSYQKAITLDEKKEFFEDIKSKLLMCGEQYYNKGVEFYNKKVFTKSLYNFEKTMSINTISNRTDTLAMYYAAMSADQGNVPDVAKKYYSRLYKMNFKKIPFYMAYQKFSKKMKDTAKALEVIQKGLQIYPDVLKAETSRFEKANNQEKVKEIKDLLESQYLNLMIEETNIYLAKGDIKKAQENLLKAIEKDPKNPSLYYTIGTNYDKIYYDNAAIMSDRMNAYTESEKVYIKAIELKPEYFDALYNLGALYFNESVRIFEGIQNEKDQKLYDAGIKKVEDFQQKALPYLEKANTIQPNDQGTLLSLKQIYARTKQYEKFKVVNQKLEDLKRNNSKFLILNFITQ